MPILEVSNLQKSYGTFDALKGISFAIEKGEILGFLGPNGAGKTTTIQIILQIITPNAGSIKLFGMDAFQNRETVLGRMNFTSAYVYLFGSLTVWENLKVFAMLYGVTGTERITKLLKEFEAYDLKDKKAVTLSSGQLTRVMVVKALLNNPELLLLDEPTSSLDPDIAAKMREILKEIHRTRGISMLYTSHNMAEIEAMCSRVIFLSHGEIVANDTPEKLTRLIPNHDLRVTFEQDPKELAAFLKERNIKGKISDHTLQVTAENEDIPDILGALFKSGHKIRDISIQEPDLEDVFLKIAREGAAKK
ncbi:MAG: ABC transporter ATP-binding protein [Parcubacteria group bacterium]|nr:ABC transporter ATP-binding protein [Parcubacteria group bacterium]MBI2637167.1 ABC transporter ATP-binding protein [Parcubacteria group bacterium]